MKSKNYFNVVLFGLIIMVIGAVLYFGVNGSLFKGELSLLPNLHISEPVATSNNANVSCRVDGEIVHGGEANVTMFISGDLKLHDLTINFNNQYDCSNSDNYDKCEIVSKDYQNDVTNLLVKNVTHDWISFSVVDSNTGKNYSTSCKVKYKNIDNNNVVENYSNSYQEDKANILNCYFNNVIEKGGTGLVQIVTPANLNNYVVSINKNDCSENSSICKPVSRYNTGSVIYSLKNITKSSLSVIVTNKKTNYKFYASCPVMFKQPELDEASNFSNNFHQSFNDLNASSSSSDTYNVEDAYNVKDAYKRCVGFDDVVEGSEYCNAVKYFKEKGVIQGKIDSRGKVVFDGTASIQRDEILKMVLTAFDFYNVNYDYCRGHNPFPDVNHIDWSYQYVCAAKSMGIAKGYQEGKDKGLFKLANHVTRAELLAFVIRNVADFNDVNDGYSYVDVPVGSWFSPYAKYIKDHGLDDGLINGSLYPSDEANRNFAISLLYNLHKAGKL